MNRKKNDKLCDAELIEFIRYAELLRDDFDFSDEFAASVYATWFLMNPLNLDGRDSVGTHPQCSVQIPHDKMRGAIKFTAHAHAKEPQTASPDDLLIYSALGAENEDTVNFITDEFSSKKVL